jgi:hypothetical protein
MTNSNNNITPEQLLARAELKANGCIEWQRAKSKYGYGMISFNNRVIAANRLMLILLHGEPSTKSVAMHSCDNPPCINPDHLRWGTHQENSRDMVAKGRGKTTPISGPNHHNAKLNKEKADIIRFMLMLGKTKKELAEYYGVGKTTIGNIAKNKIWK